MSSPTTSLTAILEQFEQAWQERPPADLGAHVPASDDPNRREVLLDLVHIDLEYRWKAGAGLPVAEYLRRYPELATDLDALTGWEAQLRQRIGGASQPEQHPNLPGYELLEELSRDQRCVVYRARQKVPDRTVAIKVIRIDLSLHPSVRQRFAAEVRKLAQLDHPGIVRVHEGEICQGQPYLVMEDVVGVSLEKLLRQGPLSPRRAAALVAHLADAVEYAHRAGVSHGDVRSANVLLSAACGLAMPSGAVPARPQAARLALDGVPRITDFGLARILHAAWEPAASEPAADILGLGAILHECLTGKPPGQAAFGPGVPTELKRICFRATDADPAQRYASATELATDLRRYLRRWLLYSALAVAGVLMILAAIWWSR